MKNPKLDRKRNRFNHPFRQWKLNEFDELFSLLETFLIRNEHKLNNPNVGTNHKSLKTLHEILKKFIK